MRALLLSAPLHPSLPTGGGSTARSAPACLESADPAPTAFVDPVSGRVLPCVALRSHPEATRGEFVDQISGRILPCVALNALEKEAAILARDAVPRDAPPRQVSAARPARVVVQAPSWAEVAAPAWPRLCSIIVDRAALTPPPPQRQLCTRGRGTPALSPRLPLLPAPVLGWIPVMEDGRLLSLGIRDARPGDRLSLCRSELSIRGSTRSAARLLLMHSRRVCLARSATKVTALAPLAPLAPRLPKLPSRPPPLPCAARPTNPPQPPTTPPKIAPVETAMAFVPGAPRQRPTKSSCMVVSTPLMEEEAYLLRTTALLPTATSACSGISPDMVVDVVQHNHRFRLGDIEVAPCFPEDFILTLAERFQRDLVFEARRNRSSLIAWLWTWNPDMIPRAADFTVLSRPDCIRSRESLPEGAPVEEGKEGPFFPVLIHLDEVKDYTPLPDEDEGSEWPRINRFSDWRLGIKDGESRGRAAAPTASFQSGRRSDEDRNDAGTQRKRGKRGGVRQRLWQRMRDQTQCRDTASYNPAPQQRRRHGEATSSAPAAIPAAHMADKAGSVPSLLARAKMALNGKLQPSQEEASHGSKEQHDKQRSEDGISDAQSLSAHQPDEQRSIPNLQKTVFETLELSDAISSAELQPSRQPRNCPVSPFELGCC
ncbi:hypothetical protein ZWY2020_014702 [Hordeum vulgare]|nr:hypothetical protein ZWY2020_014702 [Hordeum vulgare]